MTRYLVGRLLALAPVLLGVSVLAFAIMKFVPGDPARQIAGVDATEQDVQNIRHELGLDEPPWVQYLTFVGHALGGDFGRSTRSHRPVSDEIVQRLPATLELAAVALILATSVGVGLGVVAAVKRYSIWDN
ncbi:MAG: ABC transporter permease, partial [Chloroflexi bacterium]|nr:ABC transporter permease [Chloroflexota bacterium]